MVSRRSRFRRLRTVHNHRNVRFTLKVQQKLKLLQPRHSVPQKKKHSRKKAFSTNLPLKTLNEMGDIKRIVKFYFPKEHSAISFGLKQEN